MKPKNFPGKKLRRKLRAEARKNGLPVPQDNPIVVDINFRVGRKGYYAEIAHT